MIAKYILVMAWIFLVVSFLVITFKVWAAYDYQYGQTAATRMRRELDKALDINRTFPMGIWGYAFLFTLGYVITYYFL